MIARSCVVTSQVDGVCMQIKLCAVGGSNVVWSACINGFTTTMRFMDNGWSVSILVPATLVGVLLRYQPVDASRSGYYSIGLPSCLIGNDRRWVSTFYSAHTYGIYTGVRPITPVTYRDWIHCTATGYQLHAIMMQDAIEACMHLINEQSALARS